MVTLLQRIAFLCECPPSKLSNTFKRLSFTRFVLKIMSLAEKWKINIETHHRSVSQYLHEDHCAHLIGLY